MKIVQKKLLGGKRTLVCVRQHRYQWQTLLQTWISAPEAAIEKDWGGIYIQRSGIYLLVASILFSIIPL